MSSFPLLNSSAQTGLIPGRLLAYGINNDSAIQVDATTIKIGGNLTTAIPIIVEISAQTGLTTSRIQGLDCNCSFDMNQNSITNISSVSRFDGGDLYLQTQDGGNVVLSNNGTGGSINLNSIDSVNLSGNIINSFGNIDMNTNNITSLSNLTYNGGINIQNGLNNVNIISDEEGNLDLYVNKTNTDGGLNIYNYNGAYMTFYGDGIAINDATNSIVGTNPTGLTLTSDTLITLNAPTISIPNLVVNIPNNLTLDSLTYSSTISIQDNIFNSITSLNGSMTISVGNGDTGTNLYIEAYTTNFSTGVIFQNGINIKGSTTQSSPAISGNENALSFISHEILLQSQLIYVFGPIQSSGTLTLTTDNVLNLTTTSSGGTINLTASEVNMTTANASCNKVILTEQTSLPTGQAGAICYYNDTYYVYKGGVWIILI
jgi:hypothetical protein